MNIAIVTGASSGMGKEMVHQLADRFAGLNEIWVIARRKDRLDDLKMSTPVPVRRFVLDLSSEHAFTVIENALKEMNPKVRILVNAAGYGVTGPSDTIDRKREIGMIRLNDEALVRMTELVLPYMVKKSRIIQFASAAAFLPQPGFAVYAASKAFVLSYSRALNRELKKRSIYVTAVCPGPVSTEFFDLALNGNKLTSYKKWVMIRPETAVRYAILDSVLGKEVCVPGIRMKIFEILCKVLPHRFLMNFISW